MTASAKLLFESLFSEVSAEHMSLIALAWICDMFS